jgi:hypothetical protein
MRVGDGDGVDDVVSDVTLGVALDVDLDVVLNVVLDIIVLFVLGVSFSALVMLDGPEVLVMPVVVDLTEGVMAAEVSNVVVG